MRLAPLMELIWAFATLAPPLLIAIGARLLLLKRAGLRAPLVGLACGGLVGVYLFGLGEFAFRHAVTAWLPGVLPLLHTFVFAIVYTAVDEFVGKMLPHLPELHAGRVPGLVLQGVLCVLGYAVLGLVVAELAVLGKRRWKRAEGGRS